MNKTKRFLMNISVMFVILIVTACGSASKPEKDKGDDLANATSKVTDYSVALVAIKVVFSANSVISGNSITATAFGDYSNGVKNAPLNYVKWTPTGNFTIDQNGVITTENVTTSTAAYLVASYENVGSLSTAFSIEPIPIIPVNANLTSITLLPATITALNQGENIQLSAMGNYSDGSQKDLTKSTTWASADTTIANVTSGNITAGTVAGNTIISATTSGIAATRNIQALAALSSIQLSAPSTIFVGQPVNIQATGTYTDGSTQNINNSALWSSSNISAIKTTKSGHITVGDSGGVSIISVSLNNITASTNIDFIIPTSIRIDTLVNSLAPNNSLFLKASAINSATNIVDISNRIKWSVANTQIASITTDIVTNVSKLTTKAIIATTIISASAFGLSAQGNLKVVLDGTSPVVKIRFASEFISMLAGKQYKPVLLSTDENNFESVVTDPNIAWNSSKPSAASVAANGLVSSQFITTETDVTTISATYLGLSTNMPIYVAQPQVYDYISYTLDTNAEVTQVESTILTSYANVSSAPSTSGVLATIPIKVLNPNYHYLTSDSSLSNDQVAIGINNNVAGTYNKQNASIIFVKNKTNTAFYALDATANTSLTLTVDTYGMVGQKTTGSFNAVLCRDDAIDAGTCAMANNTITLAGNYSVTVDTEKPSTCYNAAQPKLIDSYTANSNQLICNGTMKSNYQLSTNIGVTYEVTAASPEAITIIADGGAPVIGVATFKATKSMSDISFSYAGASNVHSFQLKVIQQAATPEGTQTNPITAVDVKIPIVENLSVDSTTSFYKIAAKIGHSYEAKFAISDSIGTGLVISLSNNNVFTDAATVCDYLNGGCSVTATENFVYVKLQGPINGEANIILTLKYETDQYPTLTVPVVNFPGQVGDSLVPYPGPQGSTYWVDVGNLKVDTYYVISLNNIENVSQLRINSPFDNTLLVKKCSSAGGGVISPYAQCVVKTRSTFPVTVGGFPINVTADAAGTSFQISVSEVPASKTVFYASTFENNATISATSADELTQIRLYRANSTTPFYETLNDQNAFDSAAFDITTGETIGIQITERKFNGEFYSIIINSTGDTVKSSASPTKPDIFEPNDNTRTGATSLTSGTGSDHSFRNNDGTSNDIDWFQFTAP